MPPRRLRKALLVVVAVPCAAALTWLVAANGALWLAPRLISRQGPVSVAFRAHTVVPGVVHVRDFRLRAEDRWVQWALDVREGTVRVHLPALLRRTFHARQVDADGVRFRLRTKRPADALAAAPEHSYPPISGFGPRPLRDDAAFPHRRPLKDPWTLRMDQVSARAQELWVEGTRYEGEASATGAWQMTFDRLVQVDSASFDFAGGSVEHRGERIAHDAHLALQGALLPFNPREVRGAAILEQLQVTGDVRAALSPKLDAARFVPLRRPLVVSHEGGAIDAAVDLRAGVLAPGTRLRVRLPSAATRTGALRLKGDVEATAEVTPHGTVAWAVDGQRLHLRLPRHGGATISVPHTRARASSQGTAVRSLSLPSVARLDVARATLKDLRALNAIIPAPAGLLVQSGAGRVDAKLALDLERGAAAGTINVQADRLGVRYDGHELRGGLALSLKVQRLTPDLDRIDLHGSSVSLTSMRVMGTRDDRPWSGTVTLRRASVDVRRKEIFRATVSAKLTDARPLFRAAFSELKVPRWTHGLLAPRNVRADLDVAFGRSLLNVQALDARVGRFDLRGYARFDKDERRAVTQLQFGRVRVGVERVGRRTLLETFAGRDWFDRKSGLAGRAAPRARAAL